MNNQSRSWIVWGAAVASVGLGAWLLTEREPAPRDVPAPPGPASAPPAVPTAVVPPPVAMEAASSAVAAAPAMAADRFKLVGVMKQGGEGLAMIAVDGQPARGFRVGEAVGGNLVLRQISDQGAVIASRDGGAAVSLQSAPPAQPSDAAPAPQPDWPPNRDLSDGSVESERILRRLGARYPPLKPPTAADQASAALESAPTDPGRWRPPGQP